MSVISSVELKGWWAVHRAGHQQCIGDTSGLTSVKIVEGKWIVRHWWWDRWSGWGDKEAVGFKLGFLKFCCFGLTTHPPWAKQTLITTAFSSYAMRSDAIWRRNLATHQECFRRTTGCWRLGFRRVSPLLHHSYTSCTRQSTSIDGGCQCSPKETSSTPQNRCVLSCRVRLLVLTLFLSPQNNSV